MEKTMDPRGSSVDQDEIVRMRLLRRSQQRLQDSSLRGRGSMQVMLKGAARKVPMDALAREWLHCSNAGLETRRYLVEKLLPSLVLGLEKLLMEVGSRELEEVEESRPEFNPLNYLAQQLMRNNPRHSHMNASSHYSQSMREVAAQLQQMANHGGEEEIKRMRQELRRRKEQREREAALQLAEKKRRVGVVQEVVDHWCEEKAGGVHAIQLQQAVTSWLEEVKDYPQTNVPPESLAALVPPEVDHKEVWTEEKSCQELLQLCKELSVDGFTLLTSHLLACAEERKQARMRESRRTILKEVFQLWDNDGLNMVARSSLLELLTCYYTSAAPEMREKLSDPQNWPLLDNADSMSWLGEGEEEKEEERWSSMVSEEVLHQFLTSPGHTILPPPVQHAEEEVVDEKEEDEKQKEEQKEEKEREQFEEGSEEEKHLEGKVKEEQQEPDGEQRTEQDQVKEQLQEKEADSIPEQQPGAGSEYVVKDKGEEPSDGDTASAELTHTQRRSDGGLPPLPSGPGAQWSPSHLSLPQFLHLCEQFLGDQSNDEAVRSLATFLTASITDGREQLEGQNAGVSAEMRQLAFLQHKAHKISSLFLLWDSDCCGSIETEELQLVLAKWSGFSSEEEARCRIAAALGASRKLSRSQFTSLMEELSAGMEAAEFKEFSDYLQTSVKCTQEEKQRSITHQEWLASIRSAGQSGGLMAALQEAVHVIEKDGRMFGGGKHVSVCVSQLEYSNRQPCLSYKAASEDAQSYALGRKLHKNSAPVSFTVVETGTTVHIPSIAQHGRVFFFNPKLRNDNKHHGSLVVVPVVTAGGRVLGTISVDSLTRSERAATQFARHEISFLQGVGLCLGEVFCYTTARRKLIGAAETGMLWLQQRCPAVLVCDLYLVKPLQEEDGYQLVLVKAVDGSHEKEEEGSPKSKTLSRHDSYFRGYLFQCVDDSEPVSAEVYCRHHLASPLRDTSGCAAAVLDLTLSQPIAKLSSQQSRDIAKTVKLLGMAFLQMSREEEKRVEGEDRSSDALFHQLLLSDLSGSLSRVDNRVFAELRSYIDPPAVVMRTVQTLMMILHPHQEWSTWISCKQSITIDLLKDMQLFNPTLTHTHSKLDLIRSTLQEISPSEVFKHGSLPTRYLYSWVFSCAAVLQHCAIISQPSSTAPSPTKEDREEQ